MEPVCVALQSSTGSVFDYRNQGGLFRDGELIFTLATCRRTSVLNNPQGLDKPPGSLTQESIDHCNATVTTSRCSLFVWRTRPPQGNRLTVVRKPSSHLKIFVRRGKAVMLAQHSRRCRITWRHQHLQGVPRVKSEFHDTPSLGPCRSCEPNTKPRPAHARFRQMDLLDHSAPARLGSHTPPVPPKLRVLLVGDFR